MNDKVVSYKGEVQVLGDEKWYDNALRFATREEADKYVRDLYSRWTSTRSHRVTETTDPITAVFDEERSRARLIDV